MLYSKLTYVSYTCSSYRTRNADGNNSWRRSASARRKSEPNRRKRDAGERKREPDEKSTRRYCDRNGPATTRNLYVVA